MTQYTQIPATGIKGLVQNWRNDLIAAFSVSLVALTLGLGIALASGAPPMAGILSAIIGGLFTTLVRSSHAAINGPANGLIVVIAQGIDSLEGFNYVLAAIVFAGVLQVIMGILRLGRFGNILPGSVIQGMLAAIGVIILAKQFHVALGQKSPHGSALHALMEIPSGFWHQNPFLTLIAVVSLCILIIYPRLKGTFLTHLPAPVWVLVFAIPLAILLQDMKDVIPTSFHFNIEKDFVHLKAGIWDSAIFPDFSKIHEPVFWLIVISITIIGTIESLISIKAVEQLDPYKRKTDINRDLTAVGLSTIVAGFVGALPIITVILRSSVNINNGGKTRWSNFYHGAILLILIFFLGSIIEMIPLSCLAAILVFTGYKLASPKVFKDSYRKGYEQIVILIFTLLVTVASNLLIGILAGIIITLLVHYLKSRLEFPMYWRYQWKPSVQTTIEEDKSYHLDFIGIANFLNILLLEKKLNTLPRKEQVIVDFSKTNLVDYTVLEYMEEYEELYNREGGELHLVGLAIHQTSSDHPHTLHVLRNPRKGHLTQRQQKITQLAKLFKSEYHPEIHWQVAYLKDFQFFRSRPIEYGNNFVRGSFSDGKVSWELCDLSFDEGAFLAATVYHTTPQVIYLSKKIPAFVLDKEDLLDKFLKITGYGDIEFEEDMEFSNKYLVKGKDEQEIRKFFNEEIIELLKEYPVYHIESHENKVLIFKKFRLASPKEIVNMLNFSERLVSIIER